MFRQVQYALATARSLHIPLSSLVQDYLRAWRLLVADLVDRLTHLSEINLFPSSWNGATEPSGLGMGGFCQALTSQWFVWCSQFFCQDAAMPGLRVLPTGQHHH